MRNENGQNTLGVKSRRDMTFTIQSVIKLLKTKRTVPHRTLPTSVIQNQLVDVASP